MSIRDGFDGIGDRARGFFGGLKRSDRILLGVMGLVVFGLLAWLASGWMDSRTRALEAQIASTAQAQAQVDLLLGQFADLNTKVVRLDAKLAQGANFSPATWLEGLGNEMSISANIKSITERGVHEQDYYRAQKVDVVVDDLDLRQLVDLLYRIETAPQALRIEDIRVKADLATRMQLDVRMEMSVLKPLEG